MGLCADHAGQGVARLLPIPRLSERVSGQRCAYLCAAPIKLAWKHSFTLLECVICLFVLSPNLNCCYCCESSRSESLLLIIGNVEDVLLEGIGEWPWSMSNVLDRLYL